MTDRDFWLGIRQGLLQIVDSIERGKLKQKPTTSEYREWGKSTYPGPGGIQAEGVQRVAELEAKE